MLYVHLCCTHIFNTVCGSGPCASERTYQSWNSVRIGPQGWAECIGCSWSQSTGFLGLFATSILVFRENYPTLHNRASFLYILPKGDDICEQLFLKMKHRRSKISLKKILWQHHESWELQPLPSNQALMHWFHSTRSHIPQVLWCCCSLSFLCFSNNNNS